MPEIREITITWNMENSPGGVSVLHFATGNDVVGQVSALETWFDENKVYFHEGTSFRVASEGREFEDTTGVLTGVWSRQGGGSISGTSLDEPVSNSTQGLLRFKTAAVVNGRILQGRMFIPGLARSAEVGGQMSPVVANPLVADWLQFVITGGSQLIWSRPFAGTEGPPPRPARQGSSSAVIESSMWTEFAVQRGRR